MKRLVALLALSVGASAFACACASSNRPRAAAPADLFVTSPLGSVTPLPPPPVDDPASDWHTFAPRPLEGTPFHRVADLNVVAPSMWDGPCTLDEVEGALFLSCGTLARVDGERLDVAMPSPSHTTGKVYGRWPDDLWASSYEGEFSDGYTPPRDSFRETDASMFHLESGKWKKVPTDRAPMPYVDKSSLLVVTPPVTDPKAASRPSSCADYSCMRVLPRMIATGRTKPDFSALSSRITWLHHHDETEFLPDDFAFVVDPDGPVYVFMRALDLAKNRKGFGLARWTPSGGAAFEWLPATFASKKRLSFFDGVAKDGTVEIGVEGDANAWLTFDGRAWKESAPRAHAASAEAEPSVHDRFYADGGVVKERLPDGTERIVPGIEDSRSLRIVTRSAEDVWVFTTDAVYRTVRPAEVLYRTESFGALHPFPKRVAEGEACAHPFAILDAASVERAKDLRARAWAFPEDIGAVELEIFDQVVVGVPVRSVAAGEKLLEEQPQDPGRMMEGAPHHVVCARPIGATPFVSRVEGEGGD